MKLGMGWKPDIPDLRDLMMSEAPEFLAELPERVDLRETGLLPPVYHQGALGSCTANAAGAALAYVLAKEGEESFTPSRLFVYYNTRELEGSVAYDAGAYIRDSMKTLHHVGACPETVWPYDDGPALFKRRPPKDCYELAASATVTKYVRVWRADGQYIKASLARGFPVVVGFSVYDSFGRVGSDGVMPWPDVKAEDLLGGHAVLVVGYTAINGEPYWIVRNSWGADWADGGYFYMPEKYLVIKGLAQDYWSIRSEGEIEAGETP